MRAVSALAFLFMASLPSLAQERPDPAKDEWLMKPTVGLDLVDIETAVTTIKSRPLISEMTKAKGVVVTRVRPFSPAEMAGIKVSDLITTVDLRPVVSPEQFQESIKAAVPLSQVTLSVRTFSESPDGPLWKEPHNVKVTVVENGRLARRSVTLRKANETGLSLPRLREHPLLKQIAPLTVGFVVDREGYAIDGRFVASRYGKELVHADQVTITIGDRSYSLPVDKKMKTESPGKSGNAFEMAFWPLSDQTASEAFAKAMAAKAAIVTFTGTNAPMEYTLTDAQKLHLELISEAYASMKYGNVFGLNDDE